MTEFSHCPDCSTPLGKDRAKCRCGWVLPAAQPAAADLPKGHVQCAAHSQCRKPGRMWVPGLRTAERICCDHYVEDPRRFEEAAA